jgi:hypothetical protein
MDDQRTLNEDKALKDWFRRYYVKWMETCDNLRWVSAGRGEKHPLALLPFVPFGRVPGLPYTTVLATLIDQVIGLIPDELTNPLGNPGHMVSIIEDRKCDMDPISCDTCSRVHPYILLEWVYGGVVTKHKLYRNRSLDSINWNERGQEDAFNTHGIYKKIVTTPFLRKLHGLHKEWVVHGDNARYVIDFMATLVEGLIDQDARVEPPLPVFENLIKIWKQIHIEELAHDETCPETGLDEESRKTDRRKKIRAFVMRFSSRVPNLTVRTRQGELPIDLGGKCTVSISEASLFAFVDGIKLNDNLAGLTSHMLSFVQASLRRGWIQFAGLEWLSRITARLFKHRVYSLANKTQVLAKVMANPFRVAVMIESWPLILTMEDGGLTRIELFRSDDDTLTLKEHWLHLCKTHDFIHLAVRLRESPQKKNFTLKPPADLSILQRVEFYPKNDFVRFIIRKGPLQLFLKVIMPFLSA